MNIIITRYSLKGEALDGILSIDGIRICETSENAQTAIPAGTCPVVRHYCKQYSRFIPLIQVGEGLPACDGCSKLPFVCCNTTLPCICPQLKPGNGIHQRTDGSIIVGTRIVTGCLMKPKEPFEQICERLRKLDSRGSEMTLTIKNEY